MICELYHQKILSICQKCRSFQCLQCILELFEPFILNFIAQKYYTTDEECRNFLSYSTPKKDVTVNGEEIANADIEQACVTDNQGYGFFLDGNQCNERLCEYAPPTYTINKQCQIIALRCVSSKTHLWCWMHKITSNRCYWYNNDSKRYQITLCSLNKNKDYCIKDINNKECQWLEPLFHNQNEQCVDQQYNTEPLYYTTYEQCQQCLNNCIPIKNGDCKNKGNFQDSGILVIYKVKHFSNAIYN